MPVDPDPVETLLANDATRDHARAKARGERVRHITRYVVAALDGHGLLRDEDQARVVIYGALVDVLYGNASVDVDPR